MAADKTEEQISLKLIVIKERNKVLFAEAGNDFVDILFSFLTLPLGTIARLVLKEPNVQPIEVASLSLLYQSVENLNKEYLCTEACREMLLSPKNSMEVYCRSLKLNIDDAKPTEYFVCRNLMNCRRVSPVLLSIFKNKTCRCGNMLDKPIAPEISDVFAKSRNTFIITDDLKVVPNSFESAFCLHKDSGIEIESSLNEMTVTITKNQVLDILKSSLRSKTTWTDLFLEKPSHERLFERIKPPPCDSDPRDGSKVNVKIVQRKSNGKILFAQGKENFANFLFSLLTVPLGGMLHSMKGFSSMGSVEGLYMSVANLDEDYWTSKELKNKFVDRVLARKIKLCNPTPIFYQDVSNYFCYTNDYYPYDSYLTSIRRNVDGKDGYCTAVKFVDRKSKTIIEKGYVKGPTMYMATDDLVVTPMSPFSVTSLLSSMCIPVNDLKEKEVSIGINEGIRILQASLTSTSALTIGLSHLLTKVKKETTSKKKVKEKK